MNINTNNNTDTESKIYIKDKPAGITSKDYADIIKKENNLKKICFCGRLDPMARGQMLFLGDELCKKMDNYRSSQKIYQFEICFGLQTDTDDPLGIIENYKTKFDIDIITKQLLTLLKSYNCEFEQNFHKYSSILINGTPYWLHTKENNSVVEKPKHTVTIKQLDILEKKETNFEEFVNHIIYTIKNINIKHDFRQDKIIQQWEEMIPLFDKKMISLKLELHVTSGFYVRQFIRDLANQINFPFMVFDINRTNISL
jgi:tRNA pseudouridine(55) synthase|uniref:tRNA pseudouridine(55) synthase n=1 Tax=viral metagenome TaxID=1070528 RepID=A0A6C0IT38_9ZZZZ